MKKTERERERGGGREEGEERERERKKTTCSPVPSPSRHGRGTSKSTGAFLPLRRCEILCLLRNRVFFSPRPRNTQITNSADVARTGASRPDTKRIYAHVSRIRAQSSLATMKLWNCRREVTFEISWDKELRPHIDVQNLLHSDTALLLCVLD
jgi:hypothetical protein